MPSTSPGDLTAKLREEHMRYLVAELDIRVNNIIFLKFNLIEFSTSREGIHQLEYEKEMFLIL